VASRLRERSLPRLSTGETSGAWSPVLGSLYKNPLGTAAAHPAWGHKDIQGTEHLTYEEVLEEVRLLSLEKRRLGGEPFQCVQIPDGGGDEDRARLSSDTH